MIEMNGERESGKSMLAAQQDDDDDDDTAVPFVLNMANTTIEILEILTILRHYLTLSPKASETAHRISEVEVNETIYDHTVKNVKCGDLSLEIDPRSRGS